MFKFLSANSLERVQNFWVEAQNFRVEVQHFWGETQTFWVEVQNFRTESWVQAEAEPTQGRLERGPNFFSQFIA